MDAIPDEMRQRLINEGFLCIDTAGLFRSDRYILPAQIARIHEDHIHLIVSKDDLLKSSAFAGANKNPATDWPGY